MVFERARFVCAWFQSARAFSAEICCFPPSFIHPLSPFFFFSPIIFSFFLDHPKVGESHTVGHDTKKADLNASDPEMASRIIEGTARSMGIEVED